MLLAHRIRLAPNNMEANGLARAAGVARFAYNWALGEWQRQYALCKTNPALPKPKLKLAKLHERIANVRRDSLHKLTTNITRRFHTIVIEDLNVKGMLKNHCLARAIADMGFYELRRQLTYKAVQRGGTVLVADRWKSLALASASRSAGSPHAARNPCCAPSSKLCSGCGYKLDTIDLGIRQWICPACNTCHDRDVNAAINLRNSAVSSTGRAMAMPWLCACGGEGAGLAYKRVVKPSLMKQESNSKIT